MTELSLPSTPCLRRARAHQGQRHPPPKKIKSGAERSPLGGTRARGLRDPAISGHRAHRAGGRAALQGCGRRRGGRCSGLPFPPANLEKQPASSRGAAPGRFRAGPGCLGRRSSQPRPLNRHRRPGTNFWRRRSPGRASRNRRRGGRGEARRGEKPGTGERTRVPPLRPAPVAAR